MVRAEPAIAEAVGPSQGVLCVPGPAQAVVLAGLARLSERRPMVVVTATVADAERLAGDLSCFTEGVTLLPAWETLPFERVSPETATMGRRLSVLWQVFGNQAASGTVPATRLVVTPVRGALQRLGPWGEAARPAEVRAGERLDAGDLVARLVATGYRREHQVEHRGELAVRGGIVDVFPSTADVPVRIDLWGDEVDRLTTFDVADQRSLEPLASVTLFGCREVVVTEAVAERASELTTLEPWGKAQWERLADRQAFDGMESWLPWLDPDERLVTDLVGPDGQVVLVEPRRVRDRALELADEEAALAESLAATWGVAADHPPFPRLYLPFDRLLAKSASATLSLVPVAEGPSVPAVTVRGFDPVAGDAGRLARQVSGLVADGYSVTVCASNAAAAARLAAVLAEEGVIVPVTDGAAPPASAAAVAAPLERGFVLPDTKVAVLAESDVTGRRVPHRVARPRARPTDGFFDDLAPGSFVVHRQHGVARYAGVTTRTVGGTARDYLLLEYRGSDRLYLPVDQIDAVTPYSGGESPTLSKMGGADWQRTRARARAAAGEVAEELVALYRRRLAVAGHAFPADTPWQAELEASFPYVETADQLRAIGEVKADMEAPRPMDRLVCGDVGFGKTEVAVRGVFKAVQDGKQAAVLVPTTLLASQHQQTFADRYRGYPVRVELLSRFLSPAQVRAVLRGLADGSVDVVVGTHRLLGADVAFKRLGLLVVDEEQRFGVTHKEAVKRLAEGIDVLTLTASPIPRTLEMALTGIRDLSMVNTPPADRRPILTYVGEYDEAAVSEALRRELLREGQVFFVHNRVADSTRSPGASPPSSPRRALPSPTGRWTREVLSRSFSTSGSSATTCSCAPRSSSRASTCPP